MDSRVAGSVGVDMVVLHEKFLLCFQYGLHVNPLMSYDWIISTEKLCPFVRPLLICVLKSLYLGKCYNKSVFLLSYWFKNLIT